MNDIFNQNDPNQQSKEKIFETANPDTSIDEATSKISEETSSTTADKTIQEPEGEPLNNTDAFSYSNTETNDDTIFNPINFSEVVPMNDYKPMSKGLKVFTLIMALVILITGSSVAGYFLGKNSVKVSNIKKPNINLSTTPADENEMNTAQVYEQVNKSIVGILAYNTEGNGGNASGIVYSKEGYIVTNDHIYSEIPSPKFKIYSWDGKEYDAEYVAGDKISDLAVLKIKNSDLEPAVFGNSDELFSGQNVVAIGRPNGAENKSTITNGIVSALDERVQNATNYSARLIQTNCAINPGNSGGALVNMYGQVVGVTASKLAGSVYDNVGYAIPTTVMKRIVDELISKGKVVSRAKLGITYTAINSALAEINGYRNTGLLIASVAEDSGLYGKANEGDFITHINGTRVTTDDVVLDIIENCSAGDKIKVTIVTTSNTEKTVEAQLKANIGESSYTTKSSSNNNSSNSESSGGTFNFPFGE